MSIDSKFWAHHCSIGDFSISNKWLISSFLFQKTVLNRTKPFGFSQFLFQNLLYSPCSICFTFIIYFSLQFVEYLAYFYGFISIYWTKWCVSKMNKSSVQTLSTLGLQSRIYAQQKNRDQYGHCLLNIHQQNHKQILYFHEKKMVFSVDQNCWQLWNLKRI